SVLAALETFTAACHETASNSVDAVSSEITRPSEAARVVRERTRRDERIPGFGHGYYGAAADPRALVLLADAIALAPRANEVRCVRALVDAMDEAGLPKPNLDATMVALRAALGLPVGAAAGVFAVARSAGWTAHVLEQYATDRLLRPRARYVGEAPEGAGFVAGPAVSETRDASA
ncbi:MAG: citrate synthase, partial [Myxococcales bacterium]|nr:citrate synthase [Myxococcales bacterium]